MQRYLVPLLFFGLLLSACASESEFQGRNPKTADVEIGDGQVVITIPTSTPYFHLEKVQDDSAEFSQIFFRFDSEADVYLIRTDLKGWEPIPPEEDTIPMGQASIVLTEDAITITYPSGTWAFP
jgi:hypothetical protein